MKVLIPYLLALITGFAIGAETVSDIAAHNPEVQKAIEEYRSAERGEAFLADWNTVLILQKKHRAIYDAIKLGDSVFAHEGLLTLGKIRIRKEDGDTLTFGFRPRDAGEGITELIITFDDKGLIRRKSVSRYKW